MIHYLECSSEALVMLSGVLLRDLEPTLAFLFGCGTLASSSLSSFPSPVSDKLTICKAMTGMSKFLSPKQCC